MAICLDNHSPFGRRQLPHDLVPSPRPLRAEGMASRTRKGLIKLSRYSRHLRWTADRLGTAPAITFLSWQHAARFTIYLLMAESRRATHSHGALGDVWTDPTDPPGGDRRDCLHGQRVSDSEELVISYREPSSSDTVTPQPGTAMFTGSDDWKP